MNRRSFFSSLSSAVAGVYFACHVRLSDITAAAVDSIKTKTCVVNPEWEMAFLLSEDVHKNGMIVRARREVIDNLDLWVDCAGHNDYRPVSSGHPYPMRFDCDGHIIPAFIEI